MMRYGRDFDTNRAERTLDWKSAVNKCLVLGLLVSLFSYCWCDYPSTVRGVLTGGHGADENEIRKLDLPSHDDSIRVSDIIAET